MPRNPAGIGKVPAQDFRPKTRIARPPAVQALKDPMSAGYRTVDVLKVDSDFIALHGRDDFETPIGSLFPSRSLRGPKLMTALFVLFASVRLNRRTEHAMGCVGRSNRSRQGCRCARRSDRRRIRRVMPSSAHRSPILVSGRFMEAMARRRLEGPSDRACHHCGHGLGRRPCPLWSARCLAPVRTRPGLQSCRRPAYGPEMWCRCCRRARSAPYDHPDPSDELTMNGSS